MKALKNYRLHTICLIAFTVFGEAAITLPFKSSNLYSFSGFLLACGFGILLFLLLSLLMPKILLLSEKKGKLRLIFSLFCVAAAFGSVISAFLSFKDFLDFASLVLLPKAPKIISLLLIGALVFCFALVKKEAVLKFSLIWMLPVTIIILLLFILCIPSMKLMNISVFALPKASELIVFTPRYFFKIFITALPCLAFAFLLIDKNTKKGTILLGVVLGAVLLSAVFLQAVLILGSGVNYFDFPYLSSVGTLTFGNLFTRLDSFIYLVLFLGVIIKITVCIHLTKHLLALLKTKKSPLT